MLRRIDDGEIASPTASSDGRRIAFVVQRDPRPTRDNPDLLVLRDEIWLMRGDGGGAHPIRAFVRRKAPERGIVYPSASIPGGREPIESIDISADGTRLVFSRGYSALYTLDADGSRLRHVPVRGAKATGFLGSDCCGPQFAPGDRRIIGHFLVEDRFEGIATIAAGGGRVRFLERYGWGATYSDDGRLIAFLAEMPPPKEHPRQEGDSAIWMMRSDGTGVRLVSTGRRRASSTRTSHRTPARSPSRRTGARG